jgi:hypothetical protein
MMNRADRAVPRVTAQIVSRCTRRGSLSQPNSHSPRNVDSRKNAPSPLAPVPGRLQQCGEERQPDRDRHEQEVVDRRERELPPGQIGVHVSMVRLSSGRDLTRAGGGGRVRPG